MKIQYPILALFLAAVSGLSAQQLPGRSSIHQLESERSAMTTTSGEDASRGSRILNHQGTQTPRYSWCLGALVVKSPTSRLSSRPLSARVFGYHPYWSTAEAHLLYDYGALSTIGYFSYEVDSATGGYTSVHDWYTTPIIEYAHARGVKVALVVTSFGYDANDRLLVNVARQQTMIDSLIALLQARGGDGVNIDFELVRGEQRANLVSFMERLATRVRAAIPGAEISMATPAVDWSNAFDVAALAWICDYLVLMGYDYHWSSAPTAGPVAPLAGESFNVTRSVDTYLASGMPPAKLLLGVPWYGYDWPVTDSARGAATTGTGRAVFYSSAVASAQRYGRRFDEATQTPWYVYTGSTGPRQVWYEDSLSLALKYALVSSRGMGGIGIWALGYEGGRAEIWNGIRQAFAIPTRVAVETMEEDLSRFLPNPARESGLILVSAPRDMRATLHLIDILGRIVLAADVTLQTGTTRIPLDLRQLSPGAYHYVVTGEGGRWEGGIRVVP